MTDPVDPSGGLGPQVFVRDIERPELDPADGHHLARVLRLRPGDPCVVSDGRGAWRPCRFASDRPEIAGEVVVAPVPWPAVSVGFALVKGSKPEVVVQKLTELGIDTIRPFTAARSVVRWDASKQAANHRRLEIVARGAAMQCRRVHLPEVTPMCDFSEVATLAGAALADRGGRPPSLDTPLVLIGPEGGWTPDERQVDLPVIGLGPHVLRAETAAMAAGVTLAMLRSKLSAPPGPS